MIEKGYLIDFLKSLELIEQIDELEDRREEDLLDQVMDEEYKKVILLYLRELQRESQIIQRFVSEDYHLLLEYLFTCSGITGFADFLSDLQNMTKQDFKKLVQAVFFKEEDDFAVKDIENLTLSAQSKWNLFLLLEDFEAQKIELIEQLPVMYEIYDRYARELMKTYALKIQKITNLFEKSDDFYELIFREILTKSDYDERKECFVLLLSAHVVLVQYKEPHRMIAIGLYVYDYYEEKIIQQELSLVTMQQVLKVLADQTRYGIIKTIGQGMTSNKEIAKRFAISPSGVTYQMKFLLEHDIVRIDETSKQYIVNYDLIQSALANVLLDLEIPSR